MASNTNIQIANLDFNALKASLITFLQGQTVFQDYNFAGSGLSVLLDLLAVNSQYQAYYLNMVANEMFLDSAVQRNSVVSHAKLLNYTPKSAIAPTAFVNVTVNGATGSSFTLPQYTNFLSEAVDGTNYNFVTVDSTTVNTSNGVGRLIGVELKQGVPTTFTFTVDSATNPSYTFEIPDVNVDTTSLQVAVQQSSANTSYSIYNRASDYSVLNSTSAVYFLQEAQDGNYQIYFGDGILGNQLSDGNIVLVSYISTDGTAAAGANSFVLMDVVQGGTSFIIDSVVPASTGGAKESIDSIKFQAPKAYSAQGRAVSKNDYITFVQQNNLGISFDSVNVWGGEENDPPVYGQVFISLKPTGAYNLTTTQKQRLISEVLKPISVLTVTPTIVDPDYTYIKLNVSTYFNPKLTTAPAAQLATGISGAIQAFGTSSLNTFNSTFNAYGLLQAIQSYDPSIITSDFTIFVQKKFNPNLTVPSNYKLNFNTPLQRGIFQSGVSSSPAIQVRSPITSSQIIDGVFIEEVPALTDGIDTISVLNPGFNYLYAPTVTILGDGTGATAHSVIVNGAISSIVVDTPGTGYTSAIAVITPNAGDTKGQLGAAVVNLQGRYGSLRTYYSDSKNVKTILNPNVGTIDYQNGVITLTAFNIYNVDNALGQLTISVKPVSSVVSSTYNSIITIDPYDNSAITVNAIAKTS